MTNLCAEFVALHGAEQGFTLFAARLNQSMGNILKRLGGERYQRLSTLLLQALEEQQRSGAVDLHRAWISGLLSEYYDPMYAFHRDSKVGRIEFSGNHVKSVNTCERAQPDADQAIKTGSALPAHQREPWSYPERSLHH